MVRRRKPRGGQTWRTFVKNHASQIYAVDFLTQHTALFTTIYVFVVLEIATRRIVIINATRVGNISAPRLSEFRDGRWAESVGRAPNQSAEGENGSGRSLGATNPARSAVARRESPLGLGESA